MGTVRRLNLHATFRILGWGFTPSFAKKYQDFNGLMKETFAQYADEVKSGVFPGEEHSYKMSQEVLDAIEDEFGKVG